MPEFIINSDVSTDVPTVEVTVTPAKSLTLGRHRFRLVVVDDSGNQSRSDEVELIVADQEAPTAILTAARIVPFGKSFTLSGERSIDAGGGRIVRYIWTYLGPSI